MKIISTKDVSIDGVKVIIYGPSGSGKTTMLATAPNPFIISSESGLLALAGYDIPATEISTEDEFKAAYEYAKKSDYETICIDSISDISESLLSEYKEKFTDGRQAYGKLGDVISKYIRLFRDLKGKHVIFTAKESKAEVNGVAFAAPSMPGNTLTTNLPYFVDLVLRLESSKKGDRVLHTKASFTALAKDRSSKLDAKEVPNLGAIISKIQLKNETK